MPVQICQAVVGPAVHNVKKLLKALIPSYSSSHLEPSWHGSSVSAHWDVLWYDTFLAVLAYLCGSP